MCIFGAPGYSCQLFRALLNCLSWADGLNGHEKPLLRLEGQSALFDDEAASRWLHGKSKGYEKVPSLCGKGT